jgi:hypothetical protein
MSSNKSKPPHVHSTEPYCIRIRYTHYILTLNLVYFPVFR